jgi:hypothetical protein
MEALYRQIGESIQQAIPESWLSAWMDATFFTEHTSYYAEYTPSDGSVPKSFAPERSGRRAFEQLRELFRQAGKPLWCRARFEIQADGKFNMKWVYDDCDENGYARFDEQLELDEKRRHWKPSSDS